MALLPYHFPFLCLFYVLTEMNTTVQERVLNRLTEYVQKYSLSLF